MLKVTLKPTRVALAEHSGPAVSIAPKGVGCMSKLNIEAKPREIKTSESGRKLTVPGVRYLSSGPTAFHESPYEWLHFDLHPVCSRGARDKPIALPGGGELFLLDHRYVKSCRDPAVIVERYGFAVSGPVALVRFADGRVSENCAESEGWIFRVGDGSPWIVNYGALPERYAVEPETVPSARSRRSLRRMKLNRIDISK